MKMTNRLLDQMFLYKIFRLTPFQKVELSRVDNDHYNFANFARFRLKSAIDEYKKACKLG